MDEFTPTTPRVLIVEDEPRLRDLMLRALPDMGFEGQGVGSAEQAAKVMEDDAHEILVLDLNLPGMSGLELLRQVRETWPDTRAIILTGYGDLETAQEAIRLNVDDFLTKPSPLGSLETALDRARKRWTDAHQPKSPLTRTEPSDEPPVRRPIVPVSDEQVAKTLADLERVHILEALDRNSGNREATAQELGISVRKLYYRLSDYQREGYV